MKQEEKEKQKEEALKVKAEKLEQKDKEKQLAKARKNANAALRKSERAYTAMNLVMQNPFFLQLPGNSRCQFETAYSDIKAVRDRAERCIATDIIHDFAFDEHNLDIRCAQGLRAEGTIRGILAQIAAATEGLKSH